MTPYERVVRRSVAEAFGRALDAQTKTYAQLNLRGATVSNLLYGTGDVNLTTLVRVADALGCDIVIRLQDRRSS